MVNSMYIWIANTVVHDMSNTTNCLNVIYLRQQTEQVEDDDEMKRDLADTCTEAHGNDGQIASTHTCVLN